MFRKYELLPLLQLKLIQITKIKFKKNALNYVITDFAKLFLVEVPIIALYAYMLFRKNMIKDKTNKNYECKNEVM